MTNDETQVPLLATTIRTAFSRQFPGKLVVSSAVDSTQEQARRALAAGEQGPAFFLADHQLAGHGRLGRPFYSPAHTGLYLTALLPTVNVAPDLITPVMAVTICRVLEQQLPSAALTIKWVNDLYLGTGKVVGILTEMVPAPATGNQVVLLGMGINLTTATFPPKLAHRVATLAPGAQIDRNRLAAALIQALMMVARQGPPTNWLFDYRRRSLLLGRRVSLRVGNQAYTGRAVGIDGRARLVVDLGDRQRTFAAGEVTKVNW